MTPEDERKMHRQHQAFGPEERATIESLRQEIEGMHRLAAKDAAEIERLKVEAASLREEVQARIDANVDSLVETNKVIRALRAESASLRQGVETLRARTAELENISNRLEDGTLSNWDEDQLKDVISEFAKGFRAALRETEGLGTAGKAPPSDERHPNAPMDGKEAKAAHKPNADAEGLVKP